MSLAKMLRVIRARAASLFSSFTMAKGDCGCQLAMLACVFILKQTWGEEIPQEGQFNINRK